jgi:hypothetical protein
MSRFRHATVALAVFATAALGLAGCDGDTAENNEYVDDVNAVSTQLLESVKSLPAGGGSPQQISTALDQVASQVGTAATDLSAIDPPEDVAGLHDQIVSDLETLESEATNAADEVKSGGAAAAIGVVGQFVAEANRIGAEIDSTISEINGVLQD